MFYFKSKNEKHYQIVAESVLKKLTKMILICESDDESSKLPEDLKQKLSNIKSEEDLKKFMEENADAIKESYRKADEKTKPFYFKAWDCLCKAVKSTAGFVLDHLGGILFLTGILYAGHSIGWNNIMEFFTGNNPEQRKKFEKSVEADTQMKLDSIHAVDIVKQQLSPEQQREIFAMKKALPDSQNVADNATFWNWLVNWGRSDTALADAARTTAKANKNSSEQFMKEIGDASRKGADQVQKVIDEWKKKLPASPKPSVVSQSIGSNSARVRPGL